jgi:hypothetical protein
MEALKARGTLEGTNGKFFTVVFKKADGTTRRLNGRMGVSKYLRGGESKLNKEKFIIVYDVVAEGYRAVNVDTIEEIHYQKQIIR